jgi:hypothetical protein
VGSRHRRQRTEVVGGGGVERLGEAADQFDPTHARRMAITDGSGSLGFSPVVLLPPGHYEV